MDAQALPRHPDATPISRAGLIRRARQQQLQDVAAKSVLVALATHADTSAVSHLTMRELSDMTGHAASEVIKALQVLIDAELVRATSVTGYALTLSANGERS